MLHDYDGEFISECKMPEGYRVNVSANVILAGLDLIDTVLQEYKIGDVKEGTKYYRVEIHLPKELNVISRYSDAMVSKTDISKIDCHWDTD